MDIQLPKVTQQSPCANAGRRRWSWAQTEMWAKASKPPPRPHHPSNITTMLRQPLNQGAVATTHRPLLPGQPVSRAKPAVKVSMRTNSMAFPPSLVTTATVPTTPSTPPKLRWPEVAAPLGPFALQTSPLHTGNFLVDSPPPPPLTLRREVREWGMSHWQHWTQGGTSLPDCGCVTCFLMPALQTPHLLPT